MIYTWRAKYDIVLKDDRDVIVERDVDRDDVRGVNIVNAAERVRRDVENGERKGEKGEELSAVVTMIEKIG